MKKKDYFLGLDMGTSSVGWAVTDAEYKLLKAKGKDLWGIREFDEAQTAVERRTHRISRRRRQRQQVRIGLLKTYFADEIAKVDPYFYQRLENSKYFLEDKDEAVRGKNGIFADGNYSDKEYFKQYPTIFHLRKELILNQNGPYDVRLVYLAILNMFKHRGHFLNAGISGEGDSASMEEAYYNLVDQLTNCLSVDFPADKGKDFEKVLSDRNLSRSVKAERLAEICGFDKKNKKEISILKAIVGLKVDVRVIFADDVEADEKIEICFADLGYEDAIPDLQEKLGEEYFSVIEGMKQVHDIGSLANILKGEKYLSFARVEEYQKHQEDLKLLKALYRDCKTQEEYDQMFRSEKEGSYSAYVNSFNSEKYNNQKQPVRRNMKDRSREDLYKNINNALKPVEDERKQYVLDEIKKETFLPKQLTAGNGIIPNQVHKRELDAILKNAEGYLPFLKEKDESGLTTSERISQLFSFQIPYYVGPTTEESAKHNGNGWVIRKEAGAVLPWNIEQKIDMEKTSQSFIERLVRNCTYLSGEKVLAKASLEYQAYCVLNELNNLRIAGEKISVELKQGIYKDLFLKGKKVTRKALENYLVANGVLQDKSQLSGIDKDVNNALSSYGKFYALFGEELQKDEIQKMVERIIYLCTIYGDAKSMLKKSLDKEFKDKLLPEQIKRLQGFKLKDWGSLSKEMLELRACDKQTGEEISLIRAMWETNYNFMELLHSDAYTFQDSLQDKQTTALKTLADFEAEDLEEYYFSAPVKRMIWQTIQIIRELEEVLGGPPKRIFIEMTRSDEEKGDRGRKDSRGKALMELYKKIKDESRDWKAEIEKADANGSLRSKKLYLYYTQMGRCMYTGRPIDLYELMNGNQYDIDHIYPRHFVKDDNISNNLVLVNKSSNAYKSDNYPLPSLAPEVYELWKTLRDNKLITEEKYRRLTGRNPFTEEQKAGFIARQLVETSQGTKGVADLLKQIIPETTIVYSKGRNVSDFRRDFNLLKSRTANDFHHAKDAYLNIVVGNVYFVKFTQDPLHYLQKLSREKKEFHYHLGKMFERNVKRGDETAWVADDREKGIQGTIVTVKRVMDKNTPLLTRLCFESHGGISKENLHAAREANPEKYIPPKGKNEKMKDVEKYGGFSDVFGAYFFLVEHEAKGKRVRTLESLPIYLKEQVEKREDGLLEYCKNKLKLREPSIRVERIKIQSMIQINGFRYHLSGKSGNQIALRNAISLCVNQAWINYIHKVDKYIETKRLSEEITKEKNIELYELLLEKHGHGFFSKRQNPVGEKLQAGRDAFKELSVTQQCEIIEEILKLSALGPTSANLELIGGKVKSGTMFFNKNIANAKEFKLIHQSVTGIYENVIDLLTV